MQLSSYDEFVYGQRDTYRIKVALNDVIIAIFRTLNLEWPILTYKQRYFFQIFQPKRKHCSCWFRDAYLIWGHSLCKGGWRVIFCHPLLSTTSHYVPGAPVVIGTGQVMPTSCILMSPPSFESYRRAWLPMRCNVTTNFFDIPPALLLIALKLF